jgi:hypothetical protein
MNAILVIIGIAFIVFLVSIFSGNSAEDSAVAGGVAGGAVIYVIFQIAIFVFSLWVILAIFGWLF